MEIYFVKNYVRLYIACGNLMVNVDQQRNVQRLEQKKEAMFLQPLYVGTVV
jgi:chaperonin cofactor prefoldin